MLPGSIRLATIFADLNDNGALDRFAEPSSRCTLDGDHWSCELSATRLLVHRLIRTDATGVQHDRTIAVAEAYGSRGEPTSDVRLCDDSGSCAIPTVGPYAASEPGHLLGLCALDRRTADSVHVTFAAGAHEPVTFPVHQPPALSLDVATTRLAGGELQVDAYAGANVDRVLVWLGEFDDDRLVRVFATSEQPDTLLRLAARSVKATLPAIAVDRCVQSDDCRLVVQVASDVDGTPLPTITQAERFLDLL